MAFDLAACEQPREHRVTGSTAPRLSEHRRGNDRNGTQSQ
jgi:hypothetical protein